jgi:hypothetical protein
MRSWRNDTAAAAPESHITGEPLWLPIYLTTIMSHFFDKVAKIAEKADVARLADNVLQHARDEIIGEYDSNITLTALLKFVPKAS